MSLFPAGSDGSPKDRHSLHVRVHFGVGGDTASQLEGLGKESCVRERAFLDTRVSIYSEMNEIVVLSNDMSAWSREIERIRLLGAFH